MWPMLVVVLILCVLSLLIVLDGRVILQEPADADPMFTVGIVITGVSAALIASMGLAAVPIALVGIASIIVGALRNHGHHTGA